jgi:hypothetical protein
MRFLLVTLALLLSQCAMAQTPQLDPTDSDYVAQVVAANASKTNAELLAFHVKSVREATSADMTDSEAHETILGAKVGHTIIAGTSGNKRYEFITSDVRSSKLKVGESYPVVLGIAMLDMKRHKVNVKDKNSAVFLIPQSGKEPIQFRVVIKGVEEQ